MAKKSFTDVFPNSTQDATAVSINKSGQSTGDNDLTLTANNSPQSLIATLIKKWTKIFSSDNRTSNPDETVVVVYDGQSSRTEGVNTYRVDTYRIQLFKLTPTTTPKPDDY